MNKTKKKKMNKNIRTEVICLFQTDLKQFRLFGPLWL